MNRPNFEQIWQSFPDHTQYPTLDSLFRHIGGQLTANINAPGFGPNGNTCATRISHAFNYGGSPIDLRVVVLLQLEVLRGADGRLYLFRIRELKRYLREVLGLPTVDRKPPYGDTFAGTRGIMAMDVSGWLDASGHIALWNGREFREPAYDNFLNLTDDLATPKVEPRTTGAHLWKLR